MRWKEMLFGALLTLLVTVIGGLVIWKFTKEPPKPDPLPYVVYQVDSPASFKSKSTNVMFNTVRIGNLGEKTATDVVLSIEFPENTKISDFSISNSSGAAARENQKILASKDNEKIIRIQSLMPSETVTVSILSSDYKKEELKVAARHSSGLAEEGSLSNRISISPEGGAKAKEAAVSALILGLILPIMLYRMKAMTGGFRSRNNSAFVMMHQGLIDDAQKVLESELHLKGGTSFELANLGLCKALSGDFESANKLYAAAELYSKTMHIKALVAFNRAISDFESDDKEGAKKHFEIAIKIYKRRIKKYVSYSLYAQAMISSLGGYDEFMPES